VHGPRHDGVWALLRLHGVSDCNGLLHVQDADLAGAVLGRAVTPNSSANSRSRSSTTMLNSHNSAASRSPRIKRLRSLNHRRRSTKRKPDESDTVGARRNRLAGRPDGLLGQPRGALFLAAAFQSRLHALRPLRGRWAEVAQAEPSACGLFRHLPVDTLLNVAITRRSPKTPSGNLSGRCNTVIR